MISHLFAMRQAMQVVKEGKQLQEFRIPPFVMMNIDETFVHMGTITGRPTN